tara:strand:- start:241 stop:588 length:348 start_codon:yes stop_codon:yes gene_type:complete
MIKITYSYKTFNDMGKHDIESVVTINSHNFTKYLEKAKQYNEDLDNELYISEVYSQKLNFTRCLNYAVEENYSHFNITARDLKYSQLGNNPFDNVYCIPTLDFTDLLDKYQLEGY